METRDNGSSWAATADTKFVWYNWLMLLELDANDSDAALRKYSWGLDLAGQAGQLNSLESAGGIGGLVGVRNFGQTPARSYVYFCDGNGNVVQAINRSDDSIDAKYEYDAYGNNLLDASDPNESGPFADDNPFRFSTRYYDGENEDATTVVNEGTYYYGYRDYWPRLGRWGSEDPIGERGGINLYGFSENSSTTSIDPTGLTSLRPGRFPGELPSDPPDSGVDPATYNCAGLAFRTYRNHDIDDVERALAKFRIGLLDCSDRCEPCDVKCWFWRVTAKLEWKHSGVPVDLPEVQDIEKEIAKTKYMFHIVCGIADCADGRDPDCYTKSGKGPVRGPGTARHQCQFPDKYYGKLRLQGLPLDVVVRYDCGPAFCFCGDSSILRELQSR